MPDSTPARPQKFYVLAHNPNTLDEVRAYLEAGANALEPDVCFSASRAERYYVAHDHTPFANPFDAAHSLAAYLDGVRALVETGHDLALIAFDYKDGDSGDINELLQIVQDRFSRFPACAGVTVLVTVSSLDHAPFLGRCAAGRDNVGVGIDEDAHAAQVVQALQALGQTRISYGNGRVKTSPKQVYATLAAAKALQAASGGLRPRLVYAWVLEGADEIRSHLELGIDGLIVDLDTVPRLRAILQEPRYAPRYALARKGDNPFAAPPLPQYGVEVRTADVPLAGTDARLQFTLKGAAGSVSRIIDGGFRDMFEQGSTNAFTLDGVDVGAVQGLQIEALTADLGSDWLPAVIAVSGPGLSQTLVFGFGPDEWVVQGRPVFKTAA